jgi:glycosyltransferase involved in cell wall biosynthesis
MTPPNPKILYITPHCPFSPSYGGQIRALNIGRLLQRCGEVRLVMLRQKELPPDLLAKTREAFDVAGVLGLQSTPIRGLTNRLRHELDPWYLNTHGWQLDQKGRSWLRGLCESHDVVWIHNLFTANAAGLVRWPRSVLDIDDIVSQYHRSEVRSSIPWKDRLINVRRAWLWERREALLLDRFDVIGVCSEADRSYLGGSERVHTIPNGYDAAPGEPSRAPMDPPRIGFIGTVKYPPNREGIQWFIDKVWPVVKSRCPRARLRLVGDGTDGLAATNREGIDGLGWVHDSHAEIATWSLTIVPIRFGGGTRIKIAEAFSRKCPVVSTRPGAFGYDLRSGEELLLADDPAAFAGACLSILTNQELGEQIAERAWKKYAANWTWPAIGPKVAAAVEHCLALSGPVH